MWRKQQWLWALIIATGLLGGWPRPTGACSYVFLPSTFQERVAATAAIFEGIVTQIDAAGENGVTWAVVTFRVQKTWKGPQQAEVVVWTNASGRGCGYPFSKRGTYLVYAAHRQNQFFVSSCGWTRPWGEALDDVLALNLTYNEPMIFLFFSSLLVLVKIVLYLAHAKRARDPARKNM